MQPRALQQLSKQCLIRHGSGGNVGERSGQSILAALALLPPVLARKEEGGASSTKTTNPMLNPMMAEAEKMDYNLD